MSWRLRRKEILASKIDGIFNNHPFVAVVRVSGVTVGEMALMRGSLGPLKALCVKNSIFKRYVTASPNYGDMSHLAEGFTIIFYGANALESLRILGTFSKTNPGVVLQGAMLDNVLVTPSQLSSLHKQFNLGGDFKTAVLRSVQKPLYSLSLKAGLIHFIRVLDFIQHREE